jgi:hypothetical protein
MLAWLVGEVRPLDRVYSCDVFALEPEQAEAAYGVAADVATFSKGWTIRTWMLARTDTPESWTTSSENLRVHTIRMQVYWEVLPGSDYAKQFSNALEAVCAPWRALPFGDADLIIPGLPAELQAALPAMELIGPPQVKDAAQQRRIAGTYICHSGQILIEVQERIERGSLS